MIKEIVLLDKFKNRLGAKQKEFFTTQFGEFSKSITPGEWVYLLGQVNGDKYVAQVNPFVTEGPSVRIVEKYSKKLSSIENEDELALLLIKDNLVKAIERRSQFKWSSQSKRIVFGEADNLPGLTIDQYENCILCQVKTAGMYRFKKEIKIFLEQKLAPSKCYFIKNDSWAKIEVLPTDKDEDIPSIIEIKENGFNYKVDSRLIQKIGYYYDHRRNRQMLEDRLKNLNISYKNGLDLFCYLGSWGLHILRSNVDMVTFVDSGKIIESIPETLNLNGFENRARIVKQDVFKFLDEAKDQGKSFDIIVADPPAFSKSEKAKDKALLGYEKLYKKITPILQNKGLLAVASCTKNIELTDLDNLITKISNKENLGVQLLDIGLQDIDHPIKGLNDKGNYIKYLLYQIEK